MGITHLRQDLIRKNQAPYGDWARPSSEEPPVVLLKRWRWTVIQANASLTQRLPYDQHMLSSKENLKMLFPRDQNTTEQILVSLKPHQPCFGISDMAAMTFAVKYRYASMDDFAPFRSVDRGQATRRYLKSWILGYHH